MATYNFNTTGSTEYLPVNLSASEEITFHVTNSNEGSSYFTIETYPDNNGAYSSNAPKNASGSYVSSSGITTITSDDYHMSAVVENGGGTITFAPANFVSGSDLKVRGVGAKIDYSSIIDRWPNAAVAYSLRRLNSYYDGPAVKVRRSVDNEEKDINFIGTFLDTTTLETFCSGGDGFVTTWYDQSGNGYDATTTVAVRQPQIVSIGTVIKENGKPVVKFDGSNDQLVSVFGTTYAQPTYFFLTHNFHSTPAAFDAVVGSISVENRLILDSSLNYTLQAGGALAYSAYSPSQSLASYKIQKSDPKFFFNGVQQSVTGGTSIGTSGLEGVILGGVASGSATGTTPIQIQEFIAYGRDQDSNRTGIESNINSYYNIY